MKKELDTKILESIKNKVYIFLKNSGVDNPEFYLENMNRVLNLYVEDLVKQRIGKMVARSKEICIDEQFVVFDENNNPIEIDKFVEKLITSQIGHELIHATARYNGFTGIRYNDLNEGLNEGLTQMITEKIFEYTVSPNTDSYKDVKKFAKILDSTFGQKIVLDSYFGHSNKLEEVYNSLANDEMCFINFNKSLTNMYEACATFKLPYKRNEKSIAKTLYNDMNHLMIKKICMDIIIPKLKTLKQEEKEQYLEEIFETLKDDPIFSRELENVITNFQNMDINESQKRKQELEKEIEEKNNDIMNLVYMMIKEDVPITSYITFNEKGEMIRKYNHFTKIENDILQEELLAQLYKKDNVDDKLATLYSLTSNNLEFSEIAREDELLKKKVLATIKLQAKNEGHYIINDLSECEGNAKLQIESIKLPNAEPFDFNELMKISENFLVDYVEDEDLIKRKVTRNKKSGKIVTDDEINKLAEFVDLLKVCTGNKLKEEIETFYNEFSRLISSSISETGTIDTESIFNQLSKNEINGIKTNEMLFSLFENNENIMIINDFYRLLNKNAKLEVELPKTSPEFASREMKSKDIQDLGRETLTELDETFYLDETEKQEQRDFENMQNRETQEK